MPQRINEGDARAVLNAFGTGGRVIVANDGPDEASPAKLWDRFPGLSGVAAAEEPTSFFLRPPEGVADSGANEQSSDTGRVDVLVAAHLRSTSGDQGVSEK